MSPNFELKVAVTSPVCVTDKVEDVVVFIVSVSALVDIPNASGRAPVIYFPSTCGSIVITPSDIEALKPFAFNDDIKSPKV